MQSPHRPKVIDTTDGACVVECPQCRKGRAVDIPLGIGLPMFDRITAEFACRESPRRSLHPRHHGHRSDCLSSPESPPCKCGLNLAVAAPVRAITYRRPTR